MELDGGSPKTPVDEQSLKQRDERYFKWFHGKIPRNTAENLMRQNGDFLVRESIVNRDEYVLTCKYHSAYYHFKITKVKVPISPTTAATRFSLEEHNFETLLDIVLFFATGRVPVTKKTGVILSQPVERNVPLPVSEVPYASLRKGDRFSSADHGSISPTTQMYNAAPAFSSNANNSNSNFNSSQVQNTTYDVPPKPSRASVKARSQHNSSVQNTQSDVTPVPTNAEATHKSDNVDPNDNVRLRPRPFSPKKKLDNAATRRKRASCFKRMLESLLPKVNDLEGRGKCSHQRPAQYRCTLLSEENPPLEPKALSEMKNILLRTDSFKLARHMTVVDCKVCHIMDDGMEHIFLPHGSQLRQDIIERFQCTAFWVVICIIKCSSGKDERTEMLNKLIQVANELVHSMGNVLGFSAVMHGLISPQIHSMETLWTNLELKYTNNAVTFRKKLRPLLMQLDQGKTQIRMASTCIPHIMPLVRLLEHQLADATKEETAAATTGRVSPAGSPTGSIRSESSNDTKFHWWENVPDESFDSLLHHLHYGRQAVESAAEFTKTANARLSDFEEIVVVREMFTTDFQMRLLFGFRSSESPRRERFDKFDRILTAILRLIAD